MESGNMSGVHDTGSDLNLDQDATPSENPRISADKKPTAPSHSSSPGEHLGDCSGVTSISVNRQPSDNDLATPIPRTPSTKQPTEGSERTPSHVFGRTTTAATREWSMRSNESLFSLHTGNMSFTTEQLKLISKSGKFCCGYDSTLSSPLLPETPWNNMSATEFARHGGNLNLNSESLLSIRTGNMSFTSDQMNWMSKSGELNICFDPTNSGRLPDTPCKNQTVAEINEGCDGKNEAEATDTVEKEPRVRKHSVNKELSLSMPRDSEATESQHHEGDVHQEPTDASVKAFAFPILTGDADKNGSSTQSTEQTQQSQCSTTETPETLSEAANKTETTPETPKLGSPKETRESTSGNPKPQSPAATRKWLACFSCCTASATP
ncbi:hypothetical protein F3Y22_tig00110788pilonHSYRG00158 [Hibiscus syriacus]|uniref:Uncharacterized protein n=1 Tax=Hibiscus syriacus TaxID=106335 RepID=A0A6A2ZQB4_HIBSY|nr:hypothetical protein F3Y22_tig00110788pilonHSYRG00158 [Hibiscus syriacus]